MILRPIAARRARAASLALAGALLCATGCPRDAEPPVPEEVVRHNIRGTAYLGQQKWPEAEAAFRAALAARPEDPLLLTNTAIALIQQRKADEAEALLRRALESDPDHPWAHYNLALLEDARGNFEQAVRDLEAVRAADPRDLHTLYYLGNALARLGREDEAERVLREALERDPAHVSTLYGLGRLLLKRGATDEGTRLVARSQEIRARSGLDAAVGGQYGEQGPYAMGLDYPGDVLTPAEPIPLRLAPGAGGRLAHAVGGLPPSTLSQRPDGEPTLLIADGVQLRILDASGLAQPVGPPAPGPILALAAGDLVGDPALEIVALVGLEGGARLVLLAGTEPSWSAASFAGTPLSAPSAADLTLVDLDHDGDLDAFACWTASDGGGCAIATHEQEGQFRLRASAEHGVALGGMAAGAIAVGFSDLDGDRDIDLLVGETAGLHVLSNQRDGTFEDVAAKLGLAAVGAVQSLEAADLDKNGRMDLVLAGPTGVRVHLQGVDGFSSALAIGPEAEPSPRTLVLDVDNDGFLDVARAGRSLVYRNRGSAWPAESALAADGDGVPLAAFDADADGDLDLATLAGAGDVRLLVNDGGSANRWTRFAMRGVGDNTYGIGTKVEVLAGALRQRFEITGPLPLHVGLGSRDTVQSVRCLWPSGVLQDEIDLAAGSTVKVEQLDRKGTSCPLLYAWRDGAWRFVTDFLGGCAIGYRHAPGVLSVPDTDEYVLIEEGLEALDGELRIRLNNQLEEVIWFDRAELVVADHPAGTELYPDERLMPEPPGPPFRLFASSDVRPIASAREVESGRDVTGQLASRDRRWADGFARLPYKGYAEPHTLELDLGALPEGRRIVLLLDGWIDYADSTSNIGAAQAGLGLVPPRLSVADGRGGWREIEGRMGFPAGLPKTMSVELTGLFPPAERRLRLFTNMRIYWDRARVMVGGESTPLDVRRLSAATAELRFGGYPRQTSPDDRPPFAYDPNDTRPSYPWKAHAGTYTAFGDVSALLRALDDRFVTTRHGDEIELRFRAPLPAPPGWVRSYLLYADGFGKDMDPNSAAADAVAPIPFHGMPLYPYGEAVVPPAKPDAPAERRIVLPDPAGWPGATPLVLAGETPSR